MQRWIWGWFMILLVGCGSTPGAAAPTRTAAPGDERRIEAFMELSGGMKDISSRLELWNDATLTMSSTGGNVGPISGAGRATPEQFNQLQKLVQSSEFQALKPEYMPANLCCDRGTYTIEVVDGAEPRTITTVDGAEWPAPLAEIIQLFQTLQSQVILKQ